MNTGLNKKCIILVAALLLSICQITAAQTGSGYQISPTWAALPEAGWNGSTSWVAADGNGHILVMVRSAPYFRLFNRNGELVNSWGEDGQYRNAHSVTFDNQGNVWATDAARHVVYKYNMQGELLMTLGSVDEAGDNASTALFNQANHVFVADNGDIYVSDGYVNSRVIKFDSAGNFQRIFGGEQGPGNGQLNLPHGVALDSGGRVLVNDSGNERVAVFDQSGNFVEAWPVPSRGGIVVMADDTVYVSDVNAGAVNVLKNGAVVDSIKVDARPHGLAVDSDGTIYVSDARGQLVLRISR